MKRPRENAVKQSSDNIWFFVRARKSKPSVKTGFIINEDMLPSWLNKEEFLENLQEIFAKIPGHRPIRPMGSPFTSPGGRPTQALTPNNSILKRENDYGIGLKFSDENLEIKERPEADFANIEEIMAILAQSRPAGVQPDQKIIFDADLIKEIDARIHEKSSRNQNKVMAKKGKVREAGATNIAKKLGIAFEDERFEWLHRIAAFIIGMKGQVIGNLSGGTKFANTAMIIGEDEVHYISKNYQGSDFKITVKAVEMGANMGKGIEIIADSAHFVFPFNYDLLTQINPAHEDKKYVHAVVKLIVDGANELLNPNNIDANNKKSKTRITDDIKPMPIFFDDSEDEEKSLTL